MFNQIKLLAFLGILPFLSACNNALYFYETEKISLTVEARPDSSQPVQGNLGLKQRVALVTPAKCEEGKDDKDGKKWFSWMSTCEGEALSSISSFRFKVAPESEDLFNGFNPVTIRTAFITGDAAANLRPDEAEAAAIIISGAKIATNKNTANKIVNRLKKENPDGLKRLKQLCVKSWDKYTDEELKELGKITEHPPYKEKKKLHLEICNSIKEN